jgi:hypothetical protein
VSRLEVITITAISSLRASIKCGNVKRYFIVLVIRVVLRSATC